MAGVKKYYWTPEQYARQAVPGQRVVISRHGYRGVEFDKRRQVWLAYIGCNKKGTRVRLGSFYDVKDAAQAYDQAAKDRYGDGAHLNFPLNGEKKLITKYEGFCAYGHQMTDENTYVRGSDGKKECRACTNLSVSRYRRRVGLVRPL